METTNNGLVPWVIEQTPRGERQYDIFSRLLLERIIFIGSPIDNNVANIVIAQLLLLQGQDKDIDIKIYINSPGGSVSAGLAIYDTMKLVKPDVQTYCVGMAASMGAFLLAAGTKGKRFSLPNSEIMIHQILGGFHGQGTDVEIHARQVLRLKQKLNTILAHNTGQPVEVIERDTERDNFLTPEEAVKYGLIDRVIESINGG